MESQNQLVDLINKKSFVWYDDNWIHDEIAHSHHKAQFVYVEQGFQYLEINNRMYLLPQNHAAWIPPGLKHRTISSSKSIRLMTLFYTINKDDDWFYRTLHTFSAPTVLKEMLLYSSKWSKSTMESQEEEAFLGAIFSELPHFVQKSLTLNIPIPKDPRLLPVSNYLSTHFDKDNSIADLAQITHLSLRTLERIFKKETGITLSKYIQMVRIIKGVEYLASEEYTVTEVAYKVGYKSIQAFSNSFYKLIKQWPSQFNP